MMTRRQEVLRLNRFGDVGGFELVDAPLPLPGPGAVRVRVLAASVQFTDVIMRQGKYPDLTEKPPLVLGYDVVGEIDELGEGVSGLAIGDRVADLTVTGSYARYRILRADRVTRLPAGAESAQAATLVLSWVTAYQLLHRLARVQRGQRVLIQGAAGAVGRALLALAAQAGLTVWATARAADAELVRSFGATHLDFEAEKDPRCIGPGEYDVVLDGIGENGFVRSWASLREGGLLAAFGLSAGVKQGAGPLTAAWWLARLKLWEVLPSGRSAKFFSIVTLRKQRPEWYRADLEALLELLARKAIRPMVAERIGLGEVASAHRRLESGGVKGKIVICP